MRYDRFALFLLTTMISIGTTGPGAAVAATYRVAQDGSGDFTILFDAVEAAASGDTITIGPGEYTELREFVAPGGTGLALARVVVSELTIVGDGRDVVTLGPVAPAANLELGPQGISCSADGNVRVSGVTVRNVSRGVWGNGVWVEVEDSRFVGCYIGVQGSGSGVTTVLRSEFFDSEDAAVQTVIFQGGTGLILEDCRFVGNSTGFDSQVPNTFVRNCSFRGGIVGAQVSFGGTGAIEHCTFEDIYNVDLVLLGGADVAVNHCVFMPSRAANIKVQGRLTGSQNVLMGGAFATVIVTTRSSVTFNGNHILNNGGWSVSCHIGDPGLGVVSHDFTGNYWGTTDIAQIDAWINDRNDASNIWQLIDYLPIADDPIRSEESSFGELKARFGGQ